MAISGTRTAGLIFLFAAVQFVLGLAISQALYPGYSVSSKYISDLGVGPSAAVFNSSVFLLGLMLLVGAFYLKRVARFKTVNVLVVLMALGAMAVGVFTKDFTLAHGAVSTVAFLFAGLSAISSFQAVGKTWAFISIVLGAMTLGALTLFSCGMVTSGSLTSTVAYDSPFYLGLGPGGMESMIIFPAIAWLAVFGRYLVMQQERNSLTRKSLSKTMAFLQT